MLPYAAPNCYVYDLILFLYVLINLKRERDTFFYLQLYGSNLSHIILKQEVFIYVISFVTL